MFVLAEDCLFVPDVGEAFFDESATCLFGLLACFLWLLVIKFLICVTRRADYEHF